MSEPDWRPHAAALAEELIRAGKLHDGPLADAVRQTPRHLLAPVHHRRDEDGTWVEHRSGDDLAHVYANTVLVAAPGDGGLRSTSSQPGLMTRMIEALDPAAGARVLEIGTGTGYNAALLCALLGGDAVFSVDVEPDLVDLARSRLAGIGHHPTLAATDGADGLPEHALFDAILATCAVPAIPRPWIEQLRPGGVLLTDLKTAVNAGTLVRLVRTDHGAEGRFDPTYAAFMTLRHTPGVAIAPMRVAHDHDRARQRTTDLEPRAPWTLLVAWFLASFDLGPDIALGRIGGEAGATSIATPDGSWAEIDGHDVTEGGPRDLWTLLERAHERWTALGRPGWGRFGLTVDDAGQRVWLDHPERSPRWVLRR